MGFVMRRVYHHAFCLKESRKNKRENKKSFLEGVFLYQRKESNIRVANGIFVVFVFKMFKRL